MYDMSNLERVITKKVDVIIYRQIYIVKFINFVDHYDNI